MARRADDTPALYVHGDRDGSVSLAGMDQLIPNLQMFVPNLTRTVVLPRVGHWTQQERPEEPNAELLKFLADLSAQLRCKPDARSPDQP